MRFWELASGLFTTLTEEENDLVKKLAENEDCHLNEREEVIAQRLATKRCTNPRRP